MNAEFLVEKLRSMPTECFIRAQLEAPNAPLGYENSLLKEEINKLADEIENDELKKHFNKKTVVDMRRNLIANFDKLKKYTPQELKSFEIKYKQQKVIYNITYKSISESDCIKSFFKYFENHVEKFQVQFLGIKEIKS